MLWALESPSFLALDHTANYFYKTGHREVIQDILLELDEKPEAVNHFFEGLGYMPLGRYFEQLLFYIMERDPYYKVRWQNQQIINDKGITEGEIDLIVEKDTGEIEHWEIALKYYLQVKPSTDHQYYLGPSRRDFLAKKMEKLNRHQLKLGAHPQTLAEFGEIPSKLFLKGELYFPRERDLVFPEAHQAKAHLYYYLPFSQLDSLAEESPHFKILFKPDWLSPFESSDPSLMRSFHQVKMELGEQFSNLYRPQLLALLDFHEGSFVERQRFFILPDNWPQESIY